MDQVRGADTQERILNAALKVINAETISGTRMHLIAQKADVVQSNVHYYYKTKQDLLLALQEKVLEQCYEIRDQDRKKSEDTLKSQLHIFFQQKKHLISKRKEYDFAELDFLIQGKNDDKIHHRFMESYEQWRDDIREVIIRYCPRMDEETKETLPYVIVAMMQGASLQALVEENGFDVDVFFAKCEEMLLGYLKQYQ